MRISTRPSIQEDIDRLLPKLRGADREEWAHGGIEMKPALELSLGLAKSNNKYQHRTALRGLEPMMMYGVFPCDPSIEERPNAGSVWLIAHQDAPLYARALHRHCLGDLKKLYRAGGYDLLVAETWAGNPTHHEWLTWVGFERQFDYKAGPEQSTFIHFEKKA